ncbi:unnamed protein product [Lupinus luteus]|uniref:Uncharacterized protein n=1 Tax=Lupinus luteus TaxID=3873 RepID=A0AAV1W2X8_LUPLU
MNISQCENLSWRSFQTSAAESIHKIDLTIDSSTECCNQERTILLHLFHKSCRGSFGNGCFRVLVMNFSLFLESREIFKARAQEW